MAPPTPDHLIFFYIVLAKSVCEGRKQEFESSSNEGKEPNEDEDPAFFFFSFLFN